MVLKVGLTGGIGSGKTIAAAIFEVLGIPVYYADAAAKRVMREDAAIRSAIIESFGPQSYINEELNRSYIASLVFADKDKLALLNSIVHPATLHDSDKWMRAQKAPYAIKEAALIFESGANLQLDRVIGVSAPYDMRMRRVILRDGILPQAFEERMKNQMNEEEKMKLCDFVLRNDEQTLLVPQVLSLHIELLALAAKEGPAA